MENAGILAPVLALICWTFVVYFWMYATRIPAMGKADIDAGKIKRAEDLDVLPVNVKQIADNYNHLHEQPVIFYALAFYSHLANTADGLNVQLAWGYVGLRVLHSLIQGTINFVPLRFLVFLLSSLTILAIAVRNVLTLVNGAGT